MGIETKSSNLT